MHIRSLSFLHDTFPKTDCYPFNLEVFRKSGTLEFSCPVTFFIGENGTGKSTLLRSIAHSSQFHIWETQVGNRDSRNRYEGDLHKSIRLEWEDGRVRGSFFASEVFHHFAESLDAWSKADPGCLDYFGSTSLVVKSHGQSHMTFFKHRFARKGLYLLDEPENALSPVYQLELLRMLRQFPLVVNLASRYLDPYTVLQYLQDLAAAFHSFYNKQRVVSDDADLSKARIVLVDCVRIVLANGLRLLGVSMPKKM